MILILIKFAQDMDQVIHGVNNYKKLALYNLPLSIQILTINLFITCIGFVILILFNFYLINNNNVINEKKNNANEDLKKIQFFLERNAIIRVPVFDETCINENNQSCEDENNLKLSDPILEPKITQEFILNNFLNSEYDIKIYNDELIRLVDTQDLYNISIVEEVDIKEVQILDDEISIYQNLTQKYLRLFSTYHNWIIKKNFEERKTKKNSEISYVLQSIKDSTNNEYIVIDDDGILYQYLTTPIISNNKIHKAMRPRKRMRASAVLTLPLATTLSFVLSTFESISLSKKSLITQPADLVRITPTMNRNMINRLGWPFDAIKNAHSIGHNNK